MNLPLISVLYLGRHIWLVGCCLGRLAHGTWPFVSHDELSVVLHFEINPLMHCKICSRFGIAIPTVHSDLLRSDKETDVSRLGVAPPQLVTPQAKGIKNIHVLSWSYLGRSLWHQWGCVGNHAAREKTPLKLPGLPFLYKQWYPASCNSLYLFCKVRNLWN